MPEFVSPSAPPAPPRLATGTGFAGMDRDAYPGDRVMESLIKNTNLVWTGFYLTPAPSQGRALGWMGKLEFLRGLGWGVAPIYVGRQISTIPKTDHRMSPENGLIDGAHAAQLASAAGFPVGSVVFLDFEHGAPLTKDVKDYYAAWATTLRLRGFHPGVYANASLGAIAAVVPDAPMWAVRNGRFANAPPTSPFPQPDPAGSGVTNALMWQLKLQTSITYDHLDGGTKRLTPIDLSSSRVADPSVLGGARSREPRLIPR